jgi:hypothetical protein
VFDGSRTKLAVGAGRVDFHIPAVPLGSEYLADVTAAQGPLVSYQGDLHLPLQIWRMRATSATRRSCISGAGKHTGHPCPGSSHSKRYAARFSSDVVCSVHEYQHASLKAIRSRSPTDQASEYKDFNFWGVTFAQDENRFYATLWTKGNTYLVKGDLAKRTAQVIHDNVECPAISPDNRYIAFKQRSVGSLLQGRRITWRITLLDLKSGAETPLSETRSVDDQVEWLDNDHILYALSENEKGASASTDIWVLPTKQDGKPEILLKGGFSPAVVRRK